MLVFKFSVFDPRLFENIFDRIKKRVIAAVHHLGDTGVDDEFSARKTRRDGDVDGGVFDGVTVKRGLADGVLLGVDAKALFKMAAAPGGVRAARTAAGEAVFDAVGSTVVAGGQNMPVADDDRPDMAARAVRACRDHLGDIHEILVPAGTRICCLFGHFR